MKAKLQLLFIVLALHITGCATTSNPDNSDLTVAEKEFQRMQSELNTSVAKSNTCFEMVRANPKYIPLKKHVYLAAHGTNQPIKNYLNDTSQPSISDRKLVKQQSIENVPCIKEANEAWKKVLHSTKDNSSPS